MKGGVSKVSDLKLSANDSAISVSADMRLVSAVTEFVENTSLRMGLGVREALALTLAAEEVFVYLCTTGLVDNKIDISCGTGFYCVRLNFLFDAANIDIGAFNITAKVAPDDEASLDEMGLLIASRAVDRFCFSQKAGAPAKLTLICDKKYAAGSRGNGAAVPALDEYKIVTPDAEAVRIFSEQVWGLSGIKAIPAFFEFPAKLVDMIQSGEFAMCVALGPQSEAGGGIVWTKSDSKTVECFGPYIFGQPETSDMAAILIDFCLADIARTAAVGLLSRYPADLPAEYFESLGELVIRGNDGSSSTVAISFRQTKDDPGCSVCTDAGIEVFLRDKYSELAFPREIKTDWNHDQPIARRSVLATDLNRSGGQAILRPVLAGDDCSENIAGHLNLLQSENVDSILFEMDLGESWQASFVPALLANNFRPGVLLPYAGKGDIVVFQWDRI